MIIYDDTKVGAWLIDFAKTRHVPENMVLTHRQPWVPGNHEEGFLFGLDHLIEVSLTYLKSTNCGSYLVANYSIILIFFSLLRIYILQYQKTLLHLRVPLKWRLEKFG